MSLTGDSFTRANVPVALFLGDALNNPGQAQLIGYITIPLLPAQNVTTISADWNVTALYGPQVR